MRCCRAVGQPGLVTKDDVKEGVIVDVGNTPDENGKLKGDVEFEEVKKLQVQLRQFQVVLAH